MVEMFDDSVPIYQQIVYKVKLQLIAGDLKSGDKLRSVRDLAVEMGVNPNTMQKALASLEQENLLYTERTAGRFVTQDNNVIETMKKKILTEKLDEFLSTMAELGYDGNAVIDLIREQMKEDN